MMCGSIDYAVCCNGSLMAAQVSSTRPAPSGTAGHVDPIAVASRGEIISTRSFLSSLSLLMSLVTSHSQTLCPSSD
jgi:hypothetical protein